MMITIIILIVLLIICLYIIINQNNKITKYEEVVISQQEEIDLLDVEFINIQKEIDDAYNTIKTIDVKGSFEADDEVGFFFVVLKDLSVRLYNMLNTEDTNEDNNETNE